MTSNNSYKAEKDLKIPDFVRKAKVQKFSSEWWSRFFLKLVAIMSVIAFAVCTLGVLAIPVVMALAYSPIWVLLYGAYMLILLLLVSLKD